jgi:UDP-2,4-diacetamido-2,4,6-trideoxy-beta-L-altropyranose hydrolase
VAESLDRAGVAVNLGWYQNISAPGIARELARLLPSPELRSDMARRAQALVDGEGPARVVMQLQGYPLRLRTVRPEDCQLLWVWANDPEVRAASFGGEPIPWEDHVNWFYRNMRDPHCRQFLLLDAQGEPVGQVRFEGLDAKEALINVSVTQEKRGAGLGADAIRLAVAELFKSTPVDRVHAYIKLDNLKSIRAFERAGFQKIGVEKVKGHQAYHYLRAKGDKE